jgi:hypothetical protein
MPFRPNQPHINGTADNKEKPNAGATTLLHSATPLRAVWSISTTWATGLCEFRPQLE